MQLQLGRDSTIDLDKPVAIWWFINPKSAAAADAWVRRNVEKGANGIAKCRLSEPQLQQLQRAMEDGHVERVEQYSGDTVLVPAGWMHMVTNQQPCLKLAFDVYVASSFPAYIDSWMRVASKVTAAKNADDYMAVNDVVAYAFGGM